MNTANTTNGQNSINPLLKIWSFLYINKGAILSVLIAIGAYSKDSIIVQLFPRDNFKVNQKFSLHSNLDGAIGYILQPYNDSSRIFITPVCMALYINIRNDTELDKNLEGISLEYKDSLNNWKPLNALKTGRGFYISMEKDKARLVTLNGDNLLETLGLTSLKPNVIQSGWLIIESLMNSKRVNFAPKKIRITLVSAFNERETHEMKIQAKPDIINQFNDITISPQNKVINLSQCFIVPDYGFAPNN